MKSLRKRDQLAHAFSPIADDDETDSEKDNRFMHWRRQLNSFNVQCCNSKERALLVLSSN